MTIPVKSYIFSGPMIISVKSHTLVLAQFIYYGSNMIISVKSHIPGICWNGLFCHYDGVCREKLSSSHNS